ncbi:unnamed protein product [Durusdinium trenchii]|uniref:Uncharacterized protein n=2 Tax=Durusdinium trenchii TaxID=1381693 RepID=A0ABP0HJN6_9DINO
MALVAVRRSRDFPEGRVLGLDCKPLKPCGTPQTRRPRQVAPTGWTMCECEADKEWVLCDRVDAVAAEMAARIQRHLCEESGHNELDQTISDLAEVDVMKEATVRLAEIQLEQGNVEEPGAVEEDTERSEGHETIGTRRELRKEMTRAARKAAWRASQKEEQKEEHKEETNSKRVAKRGKTARNEREQHSPN